MRILEKKIKRLNPVVEMRQKKFDEETHRLNEIRIEKSRAVSAMKQAQQIYMDGVRRLNVERGSSSREMLEALEFSLDGTKLQWMKLYQDMLVVEQEEKNQLIILGKAHRDFEAIKSLQEKHQSELRKNQEKMEQKFLDEFAIGRFSRSEGS